MISRSWAAWPLSELGRFDQAAIYAAQALEAAQSSGDPILMLAALHGFTYLHCLRGEFDRAVEVGDRAMALPGMRDHTLLQWSAAIAWPLAAALVRMGQLERGTRLIEEVITSCDARGLRSGTSFTGGLLAEAYLLDGRLDDARRIAADAARTGAQRHEPVYQANAFWVSGLIDREAGARESAGATSWTRCRSRINVACVRSRPRFC